MPQKRRSAKPYDPSTVEPKIYRRWERAGVFTPSTKPRHGRKPFVIVIPLPNVTGSLHMGHALQHTVMDALTRHHRMCGDDALLVPGTDHAGIATQNVVERELQNEGTTRMALGREAFVERVWQWKKRYGQIIDDQMRKLGDSCDWSRYHFTMDQGYAQAVQEAFIHYARTGRIYRGERIINWCPRCASAISDLEVEHQEEDAVLYTIKYGPLHLATVRPETKFGDSGVAVHPKDTRYRQYVGRELDIETVLGPAKIRVVADEAVDQNFGTGVVKVTPGHDFTDFEIAARHGLPVKKVIGEDGRMNEHAGPFAGLTVPEARKAVVEVLRSKGLLVKEEPYRHTIGVCARCGTTIEPLVSKQWFVRMAPLAVPAREAIEHGLVSFSPPRWREATLDWLRNVKDWCISRQLWWGHRLPVWYCQTGRNSKFPDGHVVFSVAKPKSCPECGGKVFVQDPDVLDTWFSSALWPFAVFGWPEATADLKRFYPTSVLTTAPEILSLWVVRMIFSGLEFMDGKFYLPAKRYGKRRPDQRVPFHHVIIHPTVLTLHGKRMSKSKGTGVDPLDLIARYGADATRFGLLLQYRHDQQALRFDENAIRAARNFVNKLWNISRFLTQRMDQSTSPRRLTPFDRWILSRLHETMRAVTNALGEYRFGEAAKMLHDFVWDDYADWYVEASKMPGITSASVARDVFTTALQLLHPFTPFVTEKLWEDFGDGKGFLVVSSWPEPASERTSWAPALAEVGSVQAVARDIRAARALLAISPGTVLPVTLRGSSDVALDLYPAVEFLARVRIEIGARGKEWVPLPTRGVTGGVFLHRRALSGMDLSARLAGAERRVEETDQGITEATRRLDAMRKGAPAEVIAEAEAALAARRRERAEGAAAVSALRAISRRS